MNRARSHRIAVLESRYRPAKCQTCGGVPVRVVSIDGDTDALISESMPADGCPGCGRAIAHTLQIVGVDAWEDEVHSHG